MTSERASVPATAPVDVAVAGGRVIDPATGLDSIGTVAIDDGRISSVGEPVEARRTIEATGAIVVPGLIDLHTHVLHVDIGHGIGSFTFRVAGAALDQGFPPDTISSDLHAYNVDGPVFDQPTTLSKLLHLGVPLRDVVRMTTSAPAAALRRAEDLG